MGEIIHNKLVRDFIPKVITENGDTPVWHVLKDDERLKPTLEKIVEEAKELLESGGSAEEVVDLQDVLNEALNLLGYDEQKLEAIRIEKAKKRGGFSLGIFLDKVVTND